MAKVTFEFDDQEENSEIELIVNRSKLISAIYDLEDLFRSIYNYKLCNGEQISIKDGKVLTTEDYKKAEKPIENTKSFIEQDYIESQLDHILKDVRHLLK